MLDLMDILKGKFEQTNPGTYYEKLPPAIVSAGSEAELYEEATGVPIDYEYVDSTSWQYKNLIGNITDTKSTNAVIKTKDALDYIPSAYVVLSDGKLYQIAGVIRDVSHASKESMRLFPIPLDTEYILNLIEVPNPRGLT